MNIVWSDEAKTTYENSIDDLLKKWPIEVALDFEYKINDLLNHLKQNKQLCPVTKFKKLRKCVIHKNVSLNFYTTKIIFIS